MNPDRGLAASAQIFGTEQLPADNPNFRNAEHLL
jgi:hypothetical protein